MSTALPTPIQAWRRIEERLQPLAGAEVDLATTLGRRAAADVVARWDHPRADLSAMDGYACRGEISPGTVLTEVAEVAAAPIPKAGDDAVRVEPGSAVAIMTGGWVPAGADRVVPVEATTSKAGGRVRVDQPVKSGANIRRRGEVHRAGAMLIAAGTRLDAVHLAVAAGEGVRSLEVVPAPRLGLLVTGDEVFTSLESGELPPGALLDSHTPLVSGLCRSRGLSLRPLGVASDSSTDLASRLTVDDLDVILTTGGVSTGRHDLVPGVAAELGFEMLVHGVAVQPGKPLLVAVRKRNSGGQQWLVGLPGNPAAVLVGFHLFVDPLLRTLEGEEEAWNGLRSTVTLTAPVQPHRSRTRYLPATISQQGSTRLATPLVPVGSHDLGTYAGAQALLEIAPGERELAAGDNVEALAIHRARS